MAAAAVATSRLIDILYCARVCSIGYACDGPFSFPPAVCSLSSSVLFEFGKIGASPRLPSWTDWCPLRELMASETPSMLDRLWPLTVDSFSAFSIPLRGGEVYPIAYC